jgi:hypothetical protein
VLVSGVLVLAPPAAADEPLQASGSVVYSWHGDAARGCGLVGVCGVQGALVIQPQGEADLFSVDRAGGALAFNDGSATVRVRQGGLGSGGTCVDQPSGGFNPVELSFSARGSVTGTFAGIASSGRCAGPLAGELGRVRIHGRRSGGRRPSLDLRGTIPFAAGPFSGTVISTLRLTPATSSSGISVGSGSSSSGAPRPHRVLIERVDVRYRLTIAPSGLDIAFAGESGPFCAAVDTCGASGSLAIALGRSQAGTEISASRIVPARVSRTRALADFRAGKIPLAGGPPIGVSALPATERFRGGGQALCTDTGPMPDFRLGFGSFAPSSSGRLSITLVSFTETDLLRTHCPGPEFADVFGPGQMLGGTPASVQRLLQRQLVLTLAAGGGFRGLGYTGTRSGGVRVTLARVGLVAGTRRELAP